MLDFFHDITRSLSSERGQIRFLIQPLVAILLGARLGVADAREGRAPFLLRLTRASKQRVRMLKESLSDVVFPLSFATLIDAVIQHYAFGYVRPVAALLVGLLLVWLPYAISRALTNRLYRPLTRRGRRDIK
jgi:hypothetical protein